MNYNILLLFILTLSICAQTHEGTYMQFNDNITSITEEGDYIWAGTLTGFIKIDKRTNEIYHFNIFTGPNYTTSCYSIAVDDEGNKWIATGGTGLIKFDNTNRITYDMSNSGLPSDYIYCVYIDKNNNKWIGTTAGASKFDGVTWMTYDTSNSGISDNYVYSFAMEDNGTLWIGTEKGLSKFDGTNWFTFNSNNSSLPDDWIKKIIIDKDGKLWISSFLGITIYDHGKWGTYNSIENSFTDSGGTKWIIGSSNLLKVNNSDTTVIGFPSDHIYSVAVDRKETVWIGGLKGLARYNGSSFLCYNKANSGLPHDYVLNVFVDSKDNKWTFRKNVITKFDGNEWTTFDTSIFKIPDLSIQSLFIDEDDLIWIGTGGEGVIRFDGQNYEVFNVSNSGLPDNYVFEIASDSYGNKWMTTRMGLTKFDGEKWTVYDTSNSAIPNQFCSHLIIDKHDNKWFSTNDYFDEKKCGLVKFDNYNWYNYDSSNSGMPENILYVLALDNEGNILMITADNVLSKFDGQEWTSYSLREFGAYWQASSMAVDKNNNKYIGTQNGLVVFNEMGIVPVKVVQQIKKLDYLWLEQNYPNPFNPITTINFSIPHHSRVQLKVYDIIGREVATLVNEQKPAGEHSIKFDAAHLSSGIYIYKITAGDYTQSRKLVLLK